MNITEARQLLENHSITWDNYAGFRTVTRKRQYTSGNYIPVGIKVIKEDTAYGKTRNLNYFVTRKVDMKSDGTWVVSEIEGLMPISEVNESMTVSTLAQYAQRNANHKNDIKGRLDTLFTTEGEYESRCDSRREFNTRLNEALGLSNKHISYNNSETAPEFTITLTLAEVEALLALKVGA